MKFFLRRLSSALLLGMILMADAADTDAPEVRLTVEMRDGSRVIGVPVEKDFGFRSALLGNFKLNVKDIRTVEYVSSNAVKLATINGDVLTVGFTKSSFPLKTGFGKIDVAMNSLLKLTAATPGIGGVHPHGLVALWSGEDNGKDSVGNHDAELTHITFAEGKVGRAFLFNGHGSWANIPFTRGLEMAQADGLTISAWIKPFDVDGPHPILEWEVTRQKNAVQLWLGSSPQDHGVVFGDICDMERNDHLIISPPGTIVAGQFQHIALTYDKSTGVGTLFINGRKVSQNYIGLVTPDTSGPLSFGWRPCSRPEDSSYNAYFSGLLDEVEVYSRGLSPEEISILCTEENKGEPLPPPAANVTKSPREIGGHTF